MTFSLVSHDRVSFYLFLNFSFLNELHPLCPDLPGDILSHKISQVGLSAPGSTVLMRKMRKGTHCL